MRPAHVPLRTLSSLRYSADEPMLLPCCWQVPASMSAGWRPAEEAGLPRVFTGGWVGYCGYETVRYGYLGEHCAHMRSC